MSGVGSAAADDAAVARGRALAAEHCGGCHAVGPTGDSARPPAPRFRELSKRYPVRDLEEALGEGIITGHPEMPEFVFQADEVGDLIAYLESLQQR